MRVRIEYEACYTYDAPVSFSPLTLRILPRPGPFVRWLGWRIQTDPSGDLQHRTDLYSNQTVFVFFDAALRQRLHADAWFELELTPRNPFHFLVETRGLHAPPLYTEAERLSLAPFLSPRPGGPLSPLLPFAPLPPGAPVVETLSDLVRRLHSLVSYEARPEGPPLDPAETLARRRGACRDTALLLDAILRERGFACRLASGFLCEFQTDPGRRTASGAMHAWCEVFLPGAGWIGLDATNGVFADHHYLLCATGPEPDDVAPISGSYFSKEPVPSHLESRITLTQTAA